MRIVASLVGTVEICDISDGKKKRLKDFEEQIDSSHVRANSKHRPAY